MSHLWVNQTTVTVNGVPAALYVTLHLDGKTEAIWVAGLWNNIQSNKAVSRTCGNNLKAKCICYLFIGNINAILIKVTDEGGTN